METLLGFIESLIVWELGVAVVLLAFVIKRLQTHEVRIGDVETLTLDRPGSKVPRLLVGITKDVDNLKDDHRQVTRSLLASIDQLSKTMSDIAQRLSVIEGYLRAKKND